MKRITLLLFLVGSVLNDPLSVVVKYGGSVILPCKGNSMAVPFKLIHFRWDTDKDDPVLEFFSEVVYPGAGFETAAEISRELIGQGDFSLTVHNVTFAQEHIYECRYIDLDHTRKFLGEVRLSVTGHEENVTVTDGYPLNISLYTREAVKVQFTPEGSGDSVLVCAVEKSIVTPVQHYKPRVSIQDKTLQLSGVSFSDQGSYTVLDLRADRIISTVRVRVEGHEENVTVTNGHPLNIRLYTREAVKVQFTPEGSGDSVLVCAVEKSTVTAVQHYKPRVSLQDETLQLSGVSFSDQGSYTVLHLRTDRIISTVRVRVEDSDSTWLAPVIVGIVILAVLGAAGVISVLVRHLRSGQRLSASSANGSSRAGPSPRSSPGSGVELLGNGAAGNRPDDPGPADPLVTPQFPQSPAQPQSDGSQQEESC